MKNLTTTAASTTVNISDVDAVFKEIVNISNRTAKGVFEIGKLILDYDKSLVIKTPDFNQLEDKLITEKVMAASTISSYRTIGACAVLPNYLDVLPPFFNHMYVLATLEKKKPGFICMKLQSGELDRTTTLEVIRSWNATGKQKSTAVEKVERNGRVMLRLYVDKDSMDSVISSLQEMETQGVRMEVDYTEVAAVNTRQQQEVRKVAYRNMFKVIKDFQATKIKEFKVKFSAQESKNQFRAIYGVVGDFLEFNCLSKVFSGRVDDDQLDQVLALCGTEKAVNDFYFEALAAA
jgi:hypothetical protein